jgi:hypothetical protein
MYRSAWTWLAAAVASLIPFGAQVAAAELRNDPIALTIGASSAAVDFTVQQPMHIRVEASLDTPTQPMTLVVFPASLAGVNRVSRNDTTGRATLDIDITATDLQQYGRRWVAVVTLRGTFNPQTPLVTGRVVVSEGAAPVASAPPPRPGGLVSVPPLPSTPYTPPPPSTSSAVPPPPPPPAASSAVPPPPPPPPARQAARSGRYRVVLLGASVYRETWDTILQTDGKGDEVFFLTDVQEFTPGGASAPIRRKTPTYGDINGFPQRIQAGSRSDKGGIRTGDQIPYSTPWVRKAPVDANRLPQVLWEGVLTEGQNTVLISPTVWEEDNGDWVAGAYKNVTGTAGQLFKTIDDLRRQMPHEQFLRAINQAAQQNAPLAAITDVMNTINPVNALGAAAQWFGKQVTWLVGVAADRPIGQTLSGDQYVFIPKVLILNYQTAEQLLAPRQAAPTPVINMPMFNPAPMPPGVVEVRYRDDDRLAGDYVLYLQIERLP